MKKYLYLECQSGISGDMAVASLLDLGANEKGLIKALNSIDAHGFDIKISRVKKAGLDCCDFDVILDKHHENHDHDMNYLHGDKHIEEHHAHHEHRGFFDIKKIIDNTDISDNAKEIATKIFEVIAKAETKAHGVSFEDVHFHEVGAIDSIADIVAFAYCFDDLGITDVIVPYLCEGQGTVRCQHGILPIPVPAVTNIACEQGITLKITDVMGEMVTPTGAGIVGAIRTSDKLPKYFDIEKVGLGAGKRNYESSGILRAMIIKPKEIEE